MDEPFAPPGTPWRPVSPSLSRLRRLLLVVACGLAFAGILALEVVLGLRVALLLAAVACVLLAGVAGWVVVGRNARSWGYAEREEDLYIRHGLMFRELVAVPYGRMQYVDVNSGPLDRLFGVASVHLHTASPGTSARIPGLPTDEAARLRDRLTSLGESQAAGL